MISTQQTRILHGSTAATTGILCCRFGGLPWEFFPFNPHRDTQGEGSGNSRDRTGSTRWCPLWVGPRRGTGGGRSQGGMAGALRQRCRCHHCSAGGPAICSDGHRAQHDAEAPDTQRRWPGGRGVLSGAHADSFGGISCGAAGLGARIRPCRWGSPAIGTGMLIVSERGKPSPKAAKGGRQGRGARLNLRRSSHRTHHSAR